MLSFPPGTKMFQFPRSDLRNLCVQLRMLQHYPQQVAPFGNPRLLRSLAANRGISQLAASFFASWHLGIHHEPLIT